MGKTDFIVGKTEFIVGKTDFIVGKIEFVFLPIAPKTWVKMDPWGGLWVYPTVLSPTTKMTVATSMSKAGTPKANA